MGVSRQQRSHWRASGAGGQRRDGSRAPWLPADDADRHRGGGLLARRTLQPGDDVRASYYYYAPSMALTGTITAGKETHQVSGSAWLEHQWGNFSTADPEGYRWRWGSVRFDDGGGINWRQWQRGPDNAPVYHLNHFAIHTPEGKVTYGYGRDLTYEVLDSWVSPDTGHQYGLYALLRTPMGIFHVSPIVPDQEIVIPGLTAPLWE